MPRILVEEGSRKRTIELGERERVTVGRAASNGVVVEDTAASREHCAFELRGREWWIVDLESKNGTKLNGAPVTAARLAPGDRVEIGLARIVFAEDRGKKSRLDDHVPRELVESSGLDSFARSLGPSDARPAAEERRASSLSPIQEAAAAVFTAMGDDHGFTAVMDELEKAVLERALAEAKGNRSKAARRLQLSRPGLLKKMKRHGLK